MVFHVGKRFELDYNKNLYCVDDMLRIYYSYPWYYVRKEYNEGVTIIVSISYHFFKSMMMIITEVQSVVIIN